MVQQRLNAGVNEKPRLFLLKGALVEADQALVQAHKPFCTEQEFTSYAWQKMADGKPNKEEPQKIGDHGMDATRYVVAYLDAHLLSMQTLPQAAKLFGSREQQRGARGEPSARERRHNQGGINGSRT